jgi:AMP deaminase
MNGRYLAEITKELLSDLEESKYQHTEWRLSIYGRKRDEWAKLAAWVLDNDLLSPNNQWMIQIPRLYSVYHDSGLIRNFQEMLDNVFLPMVEATLNPEAHPKLAKFLSHISGFDSVDDESKKPIMKDRTFSSRERAPHEWDISDNPSYKYYNYFMQSNLRVLNRLRAALGLNQFSYRPHAGEAGELHHLDAAFLLADSISHGSNLRQSMPLQYLYYLARIGIAMSPCSNNHLFLSYVKSPFSEFFTRGLNMSLSTDDPLMFHQTKEPLMEEYSLAKQFFRLSSADLCELARNSVLQSGFPADVKTKWLGSASLDFNDITKSNGPETRLRFRRSCRREEMRLVLANYDDAMKAYQAGIPGLLIEDESPMVSREATPQQKPPEPPIDELSPRTLKIRKGRLNSNPCVESFQIPPEAAEGIQCVEYPVAPEDDCEMLGRRSRSNSGEDVTLLGRRLLDDVQNPCVQPVKLQRVE